MREKKINVAILNHIAIGLSRTSLDIMYLFMIEKALLYCIISGT